MSQRSAVSSHLAQVVELAVDDAEALLALALGLGLRLRLRILRRPRATVALRSAARGQRGRAGGLDGITHTAISDSGMEAN